MNKLEYIIIYIANYKMINLTSNELVCAEQFHVDDEERKKSPLFTYVN